MEETKMMKRNKDAEWSVMFVALLLMVAYALSQTGCVPPPENSSKASADSKLQQQTEKSMAEANAQIGMPAITNFQERKLAKMIFELRDKEDFVCYAYIVNMHGELKFLGKCLGYGLPYSVQYTSPQKFGTVPGGQYAARNPYTLPQADPNGLFMPEGLSATWLMMLDENGDARPVYVEPSIMVSPFPLHVSPATTLTPKDE